MASISETGHAINVANLEDLISFCTGYGTAYNPSKAAIKLPALSTLYTNAKASLGTVSTALPVWTNAVNSREIAFAPLSKLVSRIIYALDATDASKQAVADAQTIARKIKGRRAIPITTPNKEAKEGTTLADATPKHISASQLSFDSRVENFTKLIQLLSTLPTYVPNELSLQIASLNNLLTNLKAKNTSVINAATTLSNARINRNKTLYQPVNGLLDTAKDVKIYVKSVFGTNSPQYKQISSLKFKKARGI